MSGEQTPERSRRRALLAGPTFQWVAAQRAQPPAEVALHVASSADPDTSTS